MLTAFAPHFAQSVRTSPVHSQSRLNISSLSPTYVTQRRFIDSGGQSCRGFRARLYLLLIEIFSIFIRMLQYAAQSDPSPKGMFFQPFFSSGFHKFHRRNRPATERTLPHKSCLKVNFSNELSKLANFNSFATMFCCPSPISRKTRPAGAKTRGSSGINER